MIPGDVVQPMNKDVEKDVSPKEMRFETEVPNDLALPDIGVHHDDVHEPIFPSAGDSVENNVVPESRQLMEAFESLCKEVMNVKPELGNKVDELRNMFGQSLGIPVEPSIIKQSECIDKNAEPSIDQVNNVNSQPRSGTAGAVDDITYDANTEPSTLTCMIEALGYMNEPPSFPDLNCHLTDIVR